MGAEWNKANPEKLLAASRSHYQRHTEERKTKARDRRRALRAEALTIYGGVCACCGEANPVFLTIDHIEPKGHRKSEYEKKHLARWLKSHGWPSGFQTLCWNCNMAKGINGHCPHQAENVAAAA